MGAEGALSLIRKIPKQPKRESRWKSPAHLNHVRSHACVNCDSTAGIEAAHIRVGSGAGLSQKPDDWRAVSLCKECHTRQHTIGERTFWDEYTKASGYDFEDLMAEFIATSPKRREIEEARRLRDERQAATDL